MHAFFLHLKYIEEVKINLKCVQNDVTYVAKLFTTAQEFDISVSDHKFALFKSLFPQLSQLKVHTVHVGIDINNFHNLYLSCTFLPCTWILPVLYFQRNHFSDVHDW